MFRFWFGSNLILEFAVPERFKRKGRFFYSKSGLIKGTFMKLLLGSLASLELKKVRTLSQMCHASGRSDAYRFQV